MVLYQLNDSELESVIHYMQCFTDTEFIGKTLERKIVNDAYEISKRHLFYNSRPQLPDIEVYDQLEKEYKEYISKIQSKNHQANGELRVYSIVLKLTQTVNGMVKKAIKEKQSLKNDLKELESELAVTIEDLEFKEAKIDILKQRIEQPVYHLVQVYPIIQYDLPDSELSYYEQF